MEFKICIHDKKQEEHSFLIKRLDYSGEKIVTYQIYYAKENFRIRFTKTKSGWDNKLIGGDSVDDRLLDELCDQIEDEDLEVFNDYNEEDELKRMFPDESMEGFDWTLGD